ncbi:MAG: iron ABC transporter permease [Verrucomicrobia bacterium]|nr:iron ABC transporter permease [Verrucomicrobiota bacterium]
MQSVFPRFLGGDWSDAFGPYRAMGQAEDLPALLRNSLAWAGATTVTAWGLGLPCGFILARTRLPAKGFARLTLLAPIMTPPYIAALSYILIFQPGGFADRLFGLPEEIRGFFFSFYGVTAVMALSSFGYVALAVETGLRAVPPRLEDAARQLGASRVRVFAAVLFPLLLPALLNAGVLVFLDALSNFGVPAVLGSRSNLPLLPAEIYHLITSWPMNFPLATALSGLLCVFALISVFTTRWLTRHAHGKGQRAFLARETSLRPWQAGLAWLWLGGLFGVSTLLPYAAMIGMSLIERWEAGSPVWTAAHYATIFSEGSPGRAALFTSLRLSLGAATLCALVGGGIAYTAARARGSVRAVIDLLAVLPRVLPKIVMAVGLILAWNAPWIRLELYGTVWMLLLAYVVIYITDALNFGASAMSRINANLETAAEQLGAGRVRVFCEIVLPHLAPALAAAWLTTFIVCMRELVASLLLLPPGVDTTATFVFNQFEQGDIAAAMAMAAVTIGFTTAVLLLFQFFQFRHRKPKMSS